MNGTNYISAISIGLTLLLSCIGCDASPSQHNRSQMDEMASLLDKPDAPASEAETAAAEARSEPNQPSAEPQVVTAHTPRKGKSLREGGGYLSAVGAARFYAEHQMIFNQVKHALNLFQAEHGYFPRSHEEFMAKIINANSIVLPELDPGNEYWYDANDHELKFRPIAEENAPQ